MHVAFRESMEKQINQRVLNCIKERKDCKLVMHTHKPL